MAFAFCAVATPAKATMQETLSVSYKENHPNNPVYTNHVYTGDVRIRVTGHGRASGTSDSDAFYIYTDWDGNAVTPFLANEFGLHVNGRPAQSYETPAYNSSHAYEFTLFGGSEPRRLAFSFGDLHTSDNAGSLTVTVTGDAVIQPTTGPVPVPAVVYPVSGSTLTYGGSYMFKVRPVAGADGYLFGFFQNGQMVYENWRDDGSLSSNGEFAIHPDNPSHGAIKPGNLKVMVRAYRDGRWSDPATLRLNVARQHSEDNALPDLRIAEVYALDVYGNRINPDAGGNVTRLPAGGEKFSLAVQMENSGTAAVPDEISSGGLYLKVLRDGASSHEFALTESDFTVGGTSLSYFTYFGDGAFQSPLFLRTITPGYHTITFIIDSHNNITESREGNNEYAFNVYMPQLTQTSSSEEDNATDTDTTNGSVAGTTIGDTANESNTDNDAAMAELQHTISNLEQKIVELEKRLVARIDQELSRRLAGRILLQVEENGEAWYVNPDTGSKLYLQNGDAAYDIMRGLGLGMSNADLEKIPIGVQENLYDLADADGDGLPDKLEEAIGTDAYNADSDSDGFSDKSEILANYKPSGSDRYPIDATFAGRFKGRILLQVEGNGEAWYVNPDDGKRYYLGDPQTAYNAMRFLSLGVNNDDLRKIAVEEFSE